MISLAATPSSSRRDRGEELPAAHRADRTAAGLRAGLRGPEAAQNVVDYDDLLEFWLDLLRTSPEVRRLFSSALPPCAGGRIPGHQPLQAEIVDLIGAHHRVMAVGDDAQCIYSWRGANFENILTFPDRHPAR
jgi:superfamily I DNA/RNA helicase